MTWTFAQAYQNDSRRQEVAAALEAKGNACGQLNVAKKFHQLHSAVLGPACPNPAGLKTVLQNHQLYVMALDAAGVDMRASQEAISHRSVCRALRASGMLQTLLEWGLILEEAIRQIDNEDFRQVRELLTEVAAGIQEKRETITKVNAPADDGGEEEEEEGGEEEEEEKQE
jgi:hypothetical protein